MGERTDGLVKRRGLLAGAAAVAAAGLAKLGGPGRAEATHGGANDIIGGGFFNNIGNGFPTVIYNSANDAPAISGANGFLPGTASASFVNTPDGTQGITNKAGGGGVRGTGLTYGVIGQVNRGNAPASNDAVGVLGQTAFGAGMRGEVFGGGNGTGVVGVASGCEFGNASDVGVGGSGRGIGGNVANKIGVLGITDGSLGVGVAGAAIGPGTGIRGSSNSGGGQDFGGSGIGVDGRSGSGFGVAGRASSGTGVYAESISSTGAFAAGARGIWGRTTAGIGVLAQATAGGTVQNRSYGLYAAAPGPGWAGYFEGNVYVTGAIFVAGRQLDPQAGDAAAAGDTVGRATLANGRARVALPGALAGRAKADGYAVFLTEQGDLGGLYVEEQTADGFVVRARTAQAGTFDYRVVARAADGAGRRSAAAEPALDVSPPIKLPEPPAPPETPPTSETPPTESRPEPPRPGRQEAR